MKRQKLFLRISLILSLLATTLLVRGEPEVRARMPKGYWHPRCVADPYGDCNKLLATRSAVDHGFIIQPLAITEEVTGQEELKLAFELLRLINDYRVQNGLGPLTMVVPLREAALWRADDMAAHNYFGHVSSNGLQPNGVANLFGYLGWQCGENIAATTYDTQAIFNAWVNSPPHRSFILYPPLATAGIGFGYNAESEYRIYTSFLGGFDGNSYPAVPNPTTLEGDNVIYLPVVLRNFKGGRK